MYCKTTEKENDHVTLGVNDVVKRSDHVRVKLCSSDHVTLKVDKRVHDIFKEVGCRYVCTCCVRMLVCETAVAGFSSIVWRTYARSM